MARDESRAFLEGIREAPQDDAPRLVFADWLEDHGDPDRAEFIRVQIELARLSSRDERRPRLEEREGQLLRANRDSWLGPLAQVLGHGHCTFRRGFPEELTIRPKAAVEFAEEFDRRVPAGHVTPYGTFGLPAFKALLACPRSSWVAGLKLKYVSLAGAGLEVIAASPNVPHLAELVIVSGPVTTAGVRALATSPHRRALRRLLLHFSGHSGLEYPDSVTALAGPGVLFRLRALSLQGLRIGPEGATALAGAAHLAEMKELDLMGNEIGDEGAGALARSPHWRGLSTLHLHGNALTARAVRELVDSPLLEGIRELSLGCNDIGDEGAEVLAACPRLVTLEQLGLFRANLTDRGAEALAASPYLRNLRHLELAVNALTDRGSQALFDSPHLRQLEWIHISGPLVSEKIISPAQRKQWLKRLGKGARV